MASTARRDRAGALRPACVPHGATLQPSPGTAGLGRSASTAAPAAAAVRAVRRGLREQLRAIERARRGAGAGGLRPSTVRGRALGGRGRPPRLGAPTPVGLEAYRARSCAARRWRAKASTGAAWTPWNEPNNPVFIAPQRAACVAARDGDSPGLRADGTARWRGATRGAATTGSCSATSAGVTRPRPTTSSSAEFGGDASRDVVCGAVWGQHAYVVPPDGSEHAPPTRKRRRALLEPVSRALDATAARTAPHLDHRDGVGEGRAPAAAATPSEPSGRARVHCRRISAAAGSRSGPDVQVPATSTRRTSSSPLRLRTSAATADRPRRPDREGSDDLAPGVRERVQRRRCPPARRLPSRAPRPRASAGFRSWRGFADVGR